MNVIVFFTELSLCVVIQTKCHFNIIIISMSYVLTEIL